jgi:hypothetical protein
LPVHRAIIRRADPDLILRLIEEYSDTVNRRDHKARTALDLALKVGELDKTGVNEDIVIALLMHSLPYDPVSKLGVPPEKHDFAWSRIVQSDKYAGVVGTILSEHPSLVVLLAYAEDTEKRRVIDIASPICKLRLQENLWFFKRYEFVTSLQPHHKSDTCTLHIAVDHGDFGKRVALKFMRHHNEFMREIDVRRFGNFDDKYVVGILRIHDSDDDDAFLQEINRKGLDDSPYLVVMEAGERNLNDILMKEHIAGRDWAQIRSLGQQVSLSLSLFHSILVFLRVT